MAEWKLNIEEVPVERQKWEWDGNKYERFRQHISVALGNSGDNPHPFDVELTRVSPGKTPCPVHAHESTWELFIVVSGTAKVYREGREQDVLAGDCFIQPAGTRHRIRNASNDEDLVFYVIANEVKNEKTERIIP